MASTIGDFGNFVVHLDDNFCDSDLFDAARILKNNQVLFFENNKNEYYLKNDWNKLDRFFKMNKFSNIKFCLDLGHLFFKKPVKLPKEICNKLLTYPDFMENINLIHLHDFNDKEDHQRLVSGNLDFHSSKLLLDKIGHNVPIILEVPLNDIFTEGVEEINIFKKNYLTS